MNQTAPKIYDRRAVWCAAVSTLTASVLCEYIICAAIGAFYHPAAATPDYAALFVVPAGAFRPEPVEKARYIIATITLPFLLYGWFGPMADFFSRQKELETDYRCFGWLTLILGASWLAAASYGLQQLTKPHFLASPAGIAAGAALGIFLYNYGAELLEARPMRTVVYTALTIATAAVFALMVFGPGTLKNDSQYGMHFEAVFHSVAQVYSGKNLLVDFISQYGLYPFFLNPLFKITGLSVWIFTITIGVLAAGSYLLLWGALRKLLVSKTVAAAAACALMYITLGFVVYNRELFFQGVPLRLITPAAAAFLALDWFYNRRAAAYYLCGALSACAVLWNFDTGLAVFVSWCAALAYQEILARGFKEATRPMLGHLFINAGFLAAVLAVFCGYTRMHSGSWPDFTGGFAYINYFYNLGFNMLPMSLVHEWNITAFAYAGGLLYAAIQLRRRQSTPKACAIFFLSVLGCGIFVYFQGRSAMSNLLFVSWPAMLISAAGAQTLMAVPKQDGNYRPARIAGTAWLIVILFTAVSALGAIPYAVEFSASRMIQPGNAASTQKIAFIRKHSKPGESPLILSYHASVYHLYSGTKDPLNLPGFAEIYLSSDIDKLAAFIKSEKAPVFADDDFFMIHEPYARKKIAAALTENYSPVYHCGGGMTYYKPIKSQLEN